MNLNYRAGVTTRIIKLSTLLGILVSLGAGLAACHSRSKATERRYELKGKVVSVNKERRQVTIQHEDIPGYMEGMTMPFTLKDTWAFDVLSAGDRVQATLVVESSTNRSWLEDPVITKETSAETGANKTSSVAEPQPGDEVPDFTLVNQDGKRIHLHQYRGQALLLTFIYTRCPLPDYCPLMSHNFAEVDQALQQNPALSAKTHLLSISIDPDHDTPKVLRTYGAAYLGTQNPDGFKHWEFASGTPPEVKAVAQFFGLEYWQEKDQIIHSLRTAVIAPDGKLLKVYHGNEWKPAEVLADLEQLKLS